MQLAPGIKQQFFDANGDPLVGGKIFTYQAGSSTPLATYTDADGGTPNANPVILDANGECNMWIGTAAYKFIIKDANDVVLRTVDKVKQTQDGSITTDKLANDSVTQEKLVDKATQLATLTFGTITDTDPVDVTGAISNFECTGRPVVLKFLGTDLGLEASIRAQLKVTAPSRIAAIATIEIWRGLTRVSAQRFGVERGTSDEPIEEWETPGTYQWTCPATGMYLFAGNGSGANGGSSNSSASGGGGGGSGAEFSDEWLFLEEGDVLDIVVAAAAAYPGGHTDGPDGLSTTVTRSGVQLLEWRGGVGGIKGTDSTGPGGAGGVGRFFGGDGGAGGAGHATTGIVGSVGHRGIHPKSAAGGTVTASTPSAGNGGGGGAGGGSRGPGGNGPSNTGAGTSTPTRGGGGAGARGVASAVTAGQSGAPGYLAIYDAASLPGASNTLYIPPSAICVVDDPGEGEHDYSVKAYVNDEDTTLSTTGVIKLQAYEL